MALNDHADKLAGKSFHNPNFLRCESQNANHFEDLVVGSLHLKTMPFHMVLYCSITEQSAEHIMKKPEDI